MRTVLGLDRIGEYDRLFTGKRIGLITNYSGVDSSWNLNIDLFLKKGYQLVKLFTPEHGLFGSGAGEAVANAAFPGSNIPIISLFGEKDKQRPSKEELEGIDLLIYDIQDVGLRYYTYIYTMTYCMEAAAELGIQFIVLDRPNPLGNRIIAGGVIEPDCASFIGDYGLPMRYGMTPGEVGNYFIAYRNLSLDYMVIKLKEYGRDMLFPQTRQPWNVPSPALPDFTCTICYSGGCAVGASNISEGRGTPHPFLTYGAPYIDMDEFYEALLPWVDREKLLIRKKAFTPSERKYIGEICYGIELMPLCYTYDFIPLSMRILKAAADLYPNDFELVKAADGQMHISRVTGSHEMERVLEGKKDLDSLLTEWDAQSKVFAEATEQYRIYR